MHLKLLPVHSKLADPTTLPPELAKVLPPDWALSQHQVDTYQALLKPEIDVVINTAMTGDGKSLASQLLMLVYGEPMVSLYPTNELLVDQACNLIKTGAAWNTSINYTQLFGAQLDTLQTAIENTKRPDIVENLLFNHTVVLSNPDIWHLILQFGYQKGNAPTQIAQRFYERFPLFIFDEFHLYDQPQIGAVLSGLLFMLAVRNDSYPLKTLLLSATPSNFFKTLFERAGFTHRIAEISGEYTYDHINPDEKRWRTILQPVNLQVHAAPRRDLGGIEAWMQATGLEQLLHFFATQIYVKAAIIVNSVATAQRLRQTLKEPLERIGKTVESCTGLDGRAIRDRARKADVLVGTATVDVGVDFQINYLMRFEGFQSF